MTNKEFYQAIVNGTMNAEVQAKAQALLDKETNKSAQRTAQQTANRNANISLAQQFAERIGNRTLAASEIFTLVSDLVETVPKVTAVCKVGVEEGIFTVQDGYKVGGKGRGVKGYTPTTATETETVEETEDETEWA